MGGHACIWVGAFPPYLLVRDLVVGLESSDTVGLLLRLPRVLCQLIREEEEEEAARGCGQARQAGVAGA